MMDIEIQLEFYTFLREYPWHPKVQFMSDNLNNIKNHKLSPNNCVIHFIPTVEYTWECSRDMSTESNVNIRLPSHDLIQQMGLNWYSKNGVIYTDNIGTTLFIDPSTKDKGPPASLIAREPFLSFLDSNDLMLVWLIAGEKMLFSDLQSNERHIVSGVYYTDGDTISGDKWLDRE